MWRSLVAHLVRDEGVAGSNPATPTIISRCNASGLGKYTPSVGAVTAPDIAPETSVDPPPENQTATPVGSRGSGAKQNSDVDVRTYAPVSLLDKWQLQQAIFGDPKLSSTAKVIAGILLNCLNCQTGKLPFPSLSCCTHWQEVSHHLGGYLPPHRTRMAFPSTPPRFFELSFSLRASAARWAEKCTS